MERTALRLIIVATSFMALRPAFADSLTSMGIANDLGNVLAAEKPCNLSYNDKAIQKYISTHVSANDMSFPTTLQFMMNGDADDINSMSPAAKTAFCTQTERVARFNGFIPPEPTGH